MSRNSYLRYAGGVDGFDRMSDIGGVLTPPSAVLIATTLAPPIPLYAVSSLSLAQSFRLPPIGAGGDRAMVETHDDTISISAVLPGWERFLWKEALETLAESTLGGGLLGGVLGPAKLGIILWTAMTLRTDMYIQSLSFSASSAKRSALDVSMTLVHLPRPGLTAGLLDLANCAVSSTVDGLGTLL